MYCAKCGKQIEPSKFCIYCGQDPRFYVPTPEEEARLASFTPAVREKDRSVAPRVWSRIFACLGILCNLFLMLVFHFVRYFSFRALLRPKVLFNNSLTVLYLIIIAVSLVAYFMVLFRKKRSSVKVITILFAVLGGLGILGSLYGVAFDYYADIVIIPVMGIGSALLFGCYILFSIIGIKKEKILLSLIAFFISCGGIFVSMLFFSCVLEGDFQSISNLSNAAVFCLFLANLPGASVINMFLTGEKKNAK